MEKEREREEKKQLSHRHRSIFIVLDGTRQLYLYIYYTLHDLYTHPERWRSNVIQVKTRKSVVCMDSHWITGTQKNDGHLDGIPNFQTHPFV